ncbi:MAG: hypothetical protein NC238_10025 [Dehalobacter sp.]|nr:hypothetical protein [Dehalobacter sp.]
MSPFVATAQTFLEVQGLLSDHRYKEHMVETIRFLLQNAVGASYAVSTDEIIRHLEKMNLPVKRYTWEVEVLGPLRENGIFIGSKMGGRGGIFIISSKEDAKITYDSYMRRVSTETQRSHYLKELCEKVNWDIEE